MLWGYVGRGFGRTESTRAYLTAASIRGAMARAAIAAGIYTKATPHTAKHSYCTNWLRTKGSDEHSLAQLSAQVGTSVGVLRRTYLHHTFDETDRDAIRSIGSEWGRPFARGDRNGSQCWSVAAPQRGARRAGKCSRFPLGVDIGGAVLYVYRCESRVGEEVRGGGLGHAWPAGADDQRFKDWLSRPASGSPAGVQRERVLRLKQGVAWRS